MDIAGNLLIFNRILLGCYSDLLEFIRMLLEFNCISSAGRCIFQRGAASLTWTLLKSIETLL